MVVLLLDDEQERLDRFHAAIFNIDKNLEVKWWRQAWKMIDELPVWFPMASLISLDHDLFPWQDDESDPGDGLQVTKWLVSKKQHCPVIIHSSNRDRSD